MSIVRQLAKIKEKHDLLERQQNELAGKENADIPPEISNTEGADSLQSNETGLGLVDFNAVQVAVKTIAPKRKNKYAKYSDKDRYLIGKYGSEVGAAAAVRRFKRQYPILNESTVRDMMRKYTDLLKTEVGGISKKEIPKYKVPTGRPLLLGDLDGMVQKYLKAVRSRGGHVSRALAEATAKALIERYPNMNLGHIDLDNTSWSKSLFKRMGYTRRVGTTAKVPIPEPLKKEIELTFLHDVVECIEEFNIPPSLVVNLDQTPSKLVPGTKSTLAKKGSKNVPIVGMSDKRMITATFTTTLDGDFLPMQLIYGGKTQRSIPPVKFPDTFSLSANEKHYSNEKEALKHLDEILIPYFEAERKKLELPANYPALAIMDVFKGQMTGPYLQKLKENNIHLKKVPANLTYLFQPLDAQGSTNIEAKRFMKQAFTKWYSTEVIKELDAGKDLDTIEIALKLTVLKPLHAVWLIDLYNHFTTPQGRAICLKGWQVSGIYDAVQMTSSNLPTLDPFADIDPLESNEEEPDCNVDMIKRMSQVYITDNGACDTDACDSDEEFYDDGNILTRVFEDEDDEDL